MTQLQRASTLIQSGRLTRLQCHALAALLLAAASKPVDEPLATVLRSPLDASAPGRPADTTPPTPDAASSTPSEVASGHEGRSAGDLTSGSDDPTDPLSAIVRVENLAPGDRVLLRGYYLRIFAVERVTYVEFPGDVVYLDLQDIGRRRFVVSSVLPCELRPRTAVGSTKGRVGVLSGGAVFAP